MYLLAGEVQHYPWGSTSRIPRILGVEPTGEPWAEYWLGAHSSAPSPLVDAPAADLRELVASHPEVLGRASRDQFGDQLPFLLKILAASTPLSLQAHPSRAQAEAGFAAENEAGVPLDSPQRTYKDDWPKPEIIVALTPFHALSGFRDPRCTAALFESLHVKSSLASIIGPLTERSPSAGIAEVFLDVLSLDAERRHLVDEVVAAAVEKLDEPGEVGLFARTAVDLDEHYPGDPGILAALLMNRVRLNPGEALFMPAGQMHAYLRGTGVELMANSDNVLRGGLTKKHIDVDGLLQVVDFVATDVDVLTSTGADGLYRYDTPAPEFALWWIEPISGRLDLPDSASARIALVTEGSLTLHGEDADLPLACGQAAFLAADEQVSVSGAGQMFLAASGLGHDD